MSASEGGLPDLSGILSRVTENPQAMSMLSSLLGGMVEKPPKVDTPPKQDKEEEKEATPVFLPKHERRGRHEDRRRLLLALKPFLTKERQRALETLLPVLEAIDLLSFGKEPPCT